MKNVNYWIKETRNLWFQAKIFSKPRSALMQKKYQICWKYIARTSHFFQHLEQVCIMRRLGRNLTLIWKLKNLVQGIAVGRVDLNQGDE